MGSSDAEIWKYTRFYKGKQEPLGICLLLLYLVATIRRKLFKAHASSIQIQIIILIVKQNGFNYFFIARNSSDVFDMSFG